MKPFGLAENPTWPAAVAGTTGSLSLRCRETLYRRSQRKLAPASARAICALRPNNASHKDCSGGYLTLLSGGGIRCECFMLTYVSTSFNDVSRILPGKDETQSAGGGDDRLVLSRTKWKHHH